MQIIIQSVVDNAIDLADQRNSNFINQQNVNDADGSYSEIVRYANLAYRDIYNQIVLIHENYFLNSYTFQTVGGTDT